MPEIIQYIMWEDEVPELFNDHRLVRITVMDIDGKEQVDCYHQAQDAFGNVYWVKLEGEKYENLVFSKYISEQPPIDKNTIKK